MGQTGGRGHSTRFSEVETATHVSQRQNQMVTDRTTKPKHQDLRVEERS